MVNSLIIAKGATALKGAVGGAAAGATKIAMTEKTAKLTAQAFGSLESAGESGALQSMDRMFENIKNSGPVVDSLTVLNASWTSGTAGANAELMTSLINLFKSEGVTNAMEMFTGAMSDIISYAAKLIDFTTKLSDEVDKLGDIKETARKAKVDELWEDPGKITPGMQEFD